MSAICEIYVKYMCIYIYIYIDLNYCYSKCLSYINDMKTECDYDQL